jgi:hypothetical protein
MGEIEGGRIRGLTQGFDLLQLLPAQLKDLFVEGHGSGIINCAPL